MFNLQQILSMPMQGPSSSDLPNQTLMVCIKQLWQNLDRCCNADTQSLIKLDNYLIWLHPQVTSKWFEFGVAVGIAKEVMDKYSSYPGSRGVHGGDAVTTG